MIRRFNPAALQRSVRFLQQKSPVVRMYCEVVESPKDKLNELQKDELYKLYKQKIENLQIENTQLKKASIEKDNEHIFVYCVAIGVIGVMALALL